MILVIRAYVTPFLCLPLSTFKGSFASGAAPPIDITKVLPIDLGEPDKKDCYCNHNQFSLSTTTSYTKKKI